MSHRPLLSIGMPATNKRPLEDDEPSTSQNFDFNRNETHEIFKVVPDAKHVVLSTKVKEGLQTALNAMKRVVISMEGGQPYGQWMSWGEDVEQHIIARYKDIETFTSTWTVEKMPVAVFSAFRLLLNGFLATKYYSQAAQAAMQALDTAAQAAALLLKGDTEYKYEKVKTQEHAVLEGRDPSTGSP